MTTYIYCEWDDNKSSVDALDSLQALVNAAETDLNDISLHSLIKAKWTDGIVYTGIVKKISSE